MLGLLSTLLFLLARFALLLESVKWANWVLTQLGYLMDCLLVFSLFLVLKTAFMNISSWCFSSMSFLISVSVGVYCVFLFTWLNFFCKFMKLPISTFCRISFVLLGLISARFKLASAVFSFPGFGIRPRSFFYLVYNCDKLVNLSAMETPAAAGVMLSLLRRVRKCALLWSTDSIIVKI